MPLVARWQRRKQTNVGKTSISWTEHTTNFYDWHCNKVSPGCHYCYAATMAERFGKTFNGAPNWREKAVSEFLKLPPGAEAFINSMSDTFHPGAPEEWIFRIFDLAARRPDVQVMILTKRIDRAAQLLPFALATPNVWLGTSVENQDYAYRIDVLRGIRGVHKFLSCEPLLGPIEADFSGIDGVITGGESGIHLSDPCHAKRWMQPQWVLDIHAQCERDGAAHYHKQGSDVRPGRWREINGQTFDALPWRQEVAANGR
jgi:protein gp37